MMRSLPPMHNVQVVRPPVCVSDHLRILCIPRNVLPEGFKLCTSEVSDPCAHIVSCAHHKCLSEMQTFSPKPVNLGLITV